MVLWQVDIFQNGVSSTPDSRDSATSSMSDPTHYLAKVVEAEVRHRLRTKPSQANHVMQIPPSKLFSPISFLFGNGIGNFAMIITAYF